MLLWSYGLSGNLSQLSSSHQHARVTNEPEQIQVGRPWERLILQNHVLYLLYQRFNGYREPLQFVHIARLVYSGRGGEGLVQMTRLLE